jgi:hypothetical protein
MLIKIAVLFLAGMVLLSFFGLLGRKRRVGRQDGGILSAVKCPKCGRYKVGKGPCACGGDGA